jgi:hypothetical protein
MAKQASLIKFTGRLGNLIGYRCNGEHYLRSMPEKVRQTTATRRAAQRFGACSRKGRLIRRAFAGELDIYCDGGYVNRLNRALILGGNNTEAVTGFRFNQQTGTDRFFSAPPTLSQAGILHIPAQAMLWQHRDIAALEVKVIAARISFGGHRVVRTETARLILDQREPFAGAALALDLPGTDTLIVAMQVRAIRCDGSLSANRKYYAADIIAVREPSAQHREARLPGNRKYLAAGLITTAQPTVQRASRQQMTKASSSVHSLPATIQRE